MLAGINLVLTAIVFVAFGAWALIDPRTAADALGLAFKSSDGPTAIRAIYGGYLIGACLLFVYFAVDAGRRRYGLIAVLMIVGPIFAIRLFGMWDEATTTGPHLVRAGMEFTSLVVTIILLLRDQSV